jgi:hypothetical protein
MEWFPCKLFYVGAFLVASVETHQAQARFKPKWCGHGGLTRWLSKVSRAMATIPAVIGE